MKRVVFQFSAIAVALMIVQGGVNVSEALAQPVVGNLPYGWLDGANANQISGWATDSDVKGSVLVHIYINGVHHKTLTAGNHRGDLAGVCRVGTPEAGSCGFSWDPPPMGLAPQWSAVAGHHEVRVYALGVDPSTGAPNQGVELSGSPNYYPEGCTDLEGGSFGWCEGNGPYWWNRAQDTEYLSNANVRVGISKSYGGIITQLNSYNWADNLLDEHGGSALQLSFYGYGPEDASNLCHLPVSLSSPSLYNPIQAMANDCGWWGPDNDVAAWSRGPDWIHTKHSDPYNINRDAALDGLDMNQTVTLLAAGVRIDYEISYSGQLSLSNHAQEVPALFPAFGIDADYYWTNTSDKVETAKCEGTQCYVRISGRSSYPHEDFIGQTSSSDPWVSLCDEQNTRCLTVASFSPLVREFALNFSGNELFPPTPYLGPTGEFAIVPGLHKTWSVEVYPYRWDTFVAGKCIREHITGQSCQADSGVPNSTTRIDHPITLSMASSCLGAAGGSCVNVSDWDDEKARDDNTSSAWSSNLYSSPSAVGWYAFWFDQFRDTNYVRLTPRRYQDINQSLPTHVVLYYSHNGSWNYATTAVLPSDAFPSGHVIPLPTEVNTNGILVWTSALGTDTFGSHFFQLAEVAAGFSKYPPQVVTP